MCDAVQTLDDDTMFIRVHEFVVKKESTDSVNQFMLAVGVCLVCRGFSEQPHILFLEIIRELS